MTEAKWLEYTDPKKMLGYLRGKVSDRRLRLFACACCRDIWNVLVHPRGRMLVESAELHAEGQLNNRMLAARHSYAFLIGSPDREAHHRNREQYYSGYAAQHSSEQQAFEAARKTCMDAARVGGRKEFRSRVTRQVTILRDIAGNPFQLLRKRSFPAHVIGLAEICNAWFPDIGEEFLILADALEDLGEGEAAVHCREKLHVKGCHVIDWILGKS